MQFVGALTQPTHRNLQGYLMQAQPSLSMLLTPLEMPSQRSLPRTHRANSLLGLQSFLTSVLTSISQEFTALSDVA